MKINSEVATDEEKEDFLRILITGEATNAKSRYAKNYRFFQEKIQTFVEQCLITKCSLYENVNENVSRMI